jgi:broad specificity phosphatase PhoE
MPDSVILVRHTEVARKWRGRCYGVSDVGLSRTGTAELLPLAAALAAKRPQWVVHSDRIRTRRLAEAIARTANCLLLPDYRWQERDFGSWEGLSWNAIYRATGNAMDSMIDAPETYRPGGGETTFEMASRALEAFDGLPKGRGIVVTHGGPIAALLGQMRGLAPRQWLAIVPSTGASVTVARMDGSRGSRCMEDGAFGSDDLAGGEGATSNRPLRVDEKLNGHTQSRNCLDKATVYPAHDLRR